MKKIVLLIILLLVSGCFEDSGKLTTTCVKTKEVNSLTIETKYVIDFKSDIVSNVEVTQHYKDTNENTISSLKSSINSNDNEINGLKRSIKENTSTSFKIVYNINMNDSKEIQNKFFVKESRTSMVKTLESQGFSCK